MIIFPTLHQKELQFVQKLFSSKFKRYLTEDTKIAAFEESAGFDDILESNTEGNFYSELEFKHLCKTSKVLNDLAERNSWIKTKDLSPIQFGDLCICYLKMEGFSDQNSMIAITEVNEFSTLTPLLFTGKILPLGSTSHNIYDHKLAIKSLFKINAFPNETILVPDSCLKLVDN